MTYLTPFDDCWSGEIRRGRHYYVTIWWRATWLVPGSDSLLTFPFWPLLLYYSVLSHSVIRPTTDIPTFGIRRGRWFWRILVVAEYWPLRSRLLSQWWRDRPWKPVAWLMTYSIVCSYWRPIRWNLDYSRPFTDFDDRYYWRDPLSVKAVTFGVDDGGGHSHFDDGSIQLTDDIVYWRTIVDEAIVILRYYSVFPILMAKYWRPVAGDDLHHSIDQYSVWWLMKFFIYSIISQWPKIILQSHYYCACYSLIPVYYSLLALKADGRKYWWRGIPGRRARYDFEKWEVMLKKKVNQENWWRVF